MKKSPGARFCKALAQERPMQIVGVINAYVALMAQATGFRAIYLSGAAVANGAHGLPDLGLTTLHDVAEEVRRITASVELPLLVDIDTGWGGPLMIGRTIREIEKAGAAAVHIEDQFISKRCGHRPGKKIISTQEMVDKIKAAVDSRKESAFQIMARTDAAAVEGIEAAIERAIAYCEAGADLLFPEALTSLEEYSLFKKAVNIPILANITEFGKTPLFTIDELATVPVDMALYPLTIWRTMNFAALNALQTLRNSGSQRSLIDAMQSREELYTFLRYHELEAKAESLSVATNKRVYP